MNQAFLCRLGGAICRERACLVLKHEVGCEFDAALKREAQCEFSATSVGTLLKSRTRLELPKTKMKEGIAKVCSRH